MAESYYDRLGIDAEATEEEIEAAVEAALSEIRGKKKLTPKDQQEIARLEAIRDNLIDPDLREKYDESLSQPVSTAPAKAAPGRVLFDHFVVYNGEERSGFGRGELVSVREGDGADLLTIRFASGTKEIIADHPGLRPVER